MPVTVLAHNKFLVTCYCNYLCTACLYNRRYAVLLFVEYDNKYFTFSREIANFESF